ncbi:unnamed protein product, partial [Heterosigma akashiwo]
DKLFQDQRRIFRMMISFTVLHFLVFGLSVSLLPSYKHGGCLMSWDGIYLGLLALGLFFFVPWLLVKWDWNLDHFHVGKDLRKVWLILTVFGFSELVFSAWQVIVMDHRRSRLLNVLVILSQIYTFVNFIVAPLHDTVVVDRMYMKSMKWPLH